MTGRGLRNALDCDRDQTVVRRDAVRRTERRGIDGRDSRRCLRIAHVENVDGPRLRVDDEQPLRAGVVLHDLRGSGAAGIERADRRQRDAVCMTVMAAMVAIVVVGRGGLGENQGNGR